MDRGAGKDDGHGHLDPADIQGLPPDRGLDLALAAPQIYVGSVDIDQVSLLVTLHVRRPIVLNTRDSPLTLPPLRAKGLLYPLEVLLRGVAAHCVTEVLLNVVRVVGSLDLLFNPTGLVTSIQAGVRDLVRLPFQGSGPQGVIMGLGLGGASLVRHMSQWTLASIAGFSIALSRILDVTYADPHAPVDALARRPPVSPGLTSGLQGLGHGLVTGISGVIISPLRGAATGGSSGLILGMGKGLVGAIAAPVSGALQLVAHTSQGMIGKGRAPSMRPPSHACIALEQQSHAHSDAPPSPHVTRLAELLSRAVVPQSSAHRFTRQILAGTQERYIAQTPVPFATITGSSPTASPFILSRPTLVLTHAALYALEHSGLHLIARMPLRDADVTQDPAEGTLVFATACGTATCLRPNARPANTSSSHKQWEEQGSSPSPCSTPPWQTEEDLLEGTSTQVQLFARLGDDARRRLLPRLHALVTESN